MPGVLFLLLENLRNPVVWINQNTPWILLVMVLQTMYERKKEKDLNGYDDYDDASGAYAKV